MARATKQVKEELQNWLERVENEEEVFKDLERRLWKLSPRALTELSRRNESMLMTNHAGGRSTPAYIHHYVLSVKFEIQERKRKKEWIPEK